jgi:hypothetical protein
VNASAKRRNGVVDLGLRAIAAIVFASALVTAAHDMSQAWDVGYYHLPFAARLAGILPRESFVFHAANAARFEGFPLLGERLQGLVWRITGRPECTNLVAFAAVPLFAWFLRARFAVPPHLTVLALFAVPLVQTHATSGYVDLPANAAASVVVLLAIESVSLRTAPTGRTIALVLAAAAIAANMKALLHPIVALAIAVLAARVIAVRAWRALAVIAIALPLVFATPLANLVQHGNPYYPVRLSIAGHALPGVEAAYDSSPPWLEHAPRPVRFACSLAEMRIRPMSDERRWTVDQWMPDDTGGNRMGGFFGAYVLANLVLLAWRAWRNRSRDVRVACGGFAVISLVVSCMPQSHELRYYMTWMIVLVATNLWLACRAGHHAPGPRAFGVVAVLAMTIVIASTRAAYVTPTGSRLEALVASKVDAQLIDGIREGERVCVVREPWNLLWAPEFHPPKRYVVVEAERPSDCDGARLLE